MEQQTVNILESNIGLRTSDVQQALAVMREIDELAAAADVSEATLEAALALGPRTLPNGPISAFAELLASLLGRGAGVGDGLRARALVQHGAATLLLGDARAALPSLYEAIVLGSDDPALEARAALAIAYAHATVGDSDAWRRAIERAAKAVARAGEPLLQAEIGIACAFARRRGLDPDAEIDRGYAMQRIADGMVAAEPEWRSEWSDRPVTLAPGAAARIAADGSWFEVGAVRGDLSRRPVLRRVLAALVAHHRAAGEQPITVAGLLQVGWPNERFVGDSGAARVYQTIKRLRQMGLGDLLAHDGVGYWLKGAPVIEDGEAPASRRRAA